MTPSTLQRRQTTDECEKEEKHGNIAEKQKSILSERACWGRMYARSSIDEPLFYPLVFCLPSRILPLVALTARIAWIVYTARTTLTASTASTA